MQKRVLIIGLVLGAVVLTTTIVQYRFQYYDLALEVMLGVFAVIFAALGFWAAHAWIERGIAKEAHSLAGTSTSIEASAAHKAALTPKEIEVLMCIAEGLTTKQISEKLFVSANTIKTHTSSIFSKLNVSRRTEAVRKAMEIGLLIPKITQMGDA